jgi:hypothetical protein
MIPYSHITHIRAQYAYNELQIIWLTGQTLQMLESYRSYLEKQWIQQRAGITGEQLTALLANPLVSKWWAHEWARRDDLLILEALYYIVPAARLEQYRELHEMVFLAESVISIDLNESFHHLQQILKRKSKKKTQSNGL